MLFGHVAAVTASVRATSHMISEWCATSQRQTPRNTFKILSNLPSSKPCHFPSTLLKTHTNTKTPFQKPPSKPISKPPPRPNPFEVHSDASSNDPSKLPSQPLAQTPFKTPFQISSFKTFLPFTSSLRQTPSKSFSLHLQKAFTSLENLFAALQHLFETPSNTKSKPTFHKPPVQNLFPNLVPKTTSNMFPKHISNKHFLAHLSKLHSPLRSKTVTKPHSDLTSKTPSECPSKPPSEATSEAPLNLPPCEFSSEQRCENRTETPLELLRSFF